MCPYARFQGAMLDRDTLVIGYDPARGESRGSRPRTVNPKSMGLGDCIDCTLCVQVCPTGIDIRDGLQSNCIGCAACIDVCDSVMDQMNYPRGLIRYSTENGLAHGWDKTTLLKRVLRSPVRLDVIRDRGVMARTMNDGAVENVYRLHIMNATESVQRYRIGVLGTVGLTLVKPLEVELGPIEEKTVPVGVSLPGTAATPLAGRTIQFKFEIKQLGHDEEEIHVTEHATFQTPR